MPHQVEYHGEPINDDVYAIVILHACPRCHADMGQFCINPRTHATSRVPCQKRLQPVTFPDDLGKINDEDIPAVTDEDRAYYT